MKSREEAQKEEKIFRLYVADSLFHMNRNSRLVDKYSDVLARNKSNTKKIVKSGDEIISDMFKIHGLKFRKGGSTE